MASDMEERDGAVNGLEALSVSSVVVPGVHGWDFDDIATTINPDSAKELLELNVDYNRPIRERHVKVLANAMSTGEFMDTGATLSLDVTGRIIDGQHRLSACVLSGVPFRAVIITNLPETAYTKTDKGKKRSLGDSMGYHGFSSQNRVAALSKLATNWDDGLRSGEIMRFDPPEEKIIEYALDHRAEIEYAASGSGMLKGVIGTRLSDLMVLLTRRADIDDSEVFFDIMNTGLGSERGLVFTRETLMKDRMSKVSRGQYWQLGMLMRTWNLWREGSLPQKASVVFTPGGSKANKLPMDLV